MKNFLWKSFQGRPITKCVFVLVVLLAQGMGYPQGPQDLQLRPMPMGVSISTTDGVPGGFRFAGTAGLMVRSFFIPDHKFILSNNHVLGANTPTLCPNTAPFFTRVIQPGSLDIGSDPGDDLVFLIGATLGHFPIDFSPGASNLIDAALAFTNEDLAQAEIHGIGMPNPSVGIAVPGMQVMKSGRTTGVTFGTVQANNATVNVNYGSDCGVARFVGQVVITPGGFSAAGDSGSAILDTATSTPVGLLFAGSSTQTIANHLVFVYLSLGVVVDGADAPGLEEVVRRLYALERDPVRRRLKAIQRRWEQRILSIHNVVGMGIGQSENSNDPAFVVFLNQDSPQLRESIPSDLDNVPVRLVESGEFKAY